MEDMPPSPRVNVPSREPAWGERESDEQVQPTVFGIWEELATRRKLQPVEGLPRSRHYPLPRPPRGEQWMMTSRANGLGEQIPPIANDKDWRAIARLFPWSLHGSIVQPVEHSPRPLGMPKSPQPQWFGERDKGAVPFRATGEIMGATAPIRCGLQSLYL